MTMTQGPILMEWACGVGEGGFGGSGGFPDGVVAEPVFEFFPGPGGFPEEGEAGFDGGIEEEAADRDLVGEVAPAVAGDHGFEDGFEGDAVERVVRVGIWHAPVWCGDGGRGRRDALGWF